MNLCFSVLGRTQLCPIFSVNYVERRVPLKAFALCMPFCGDRQGLVFLPPSCDLFIEMKRRFSQSGPSLHIVESAPFEAYSECLRHTSSFSSSIFHLSVLLILCLQVSVIKLLSHLWSWTLFSVLLLWSACRHAPVHTFKNNDLSIFILGSATHQLYFSAVVMLHLMAHLNGRQRRYIVDSYNCQYNRHYHPILY